MFLIIREKTFANNESVFSIVGQYKTKDIAEEKRSAFKVIEDKGDVFFYIFETIYEFLIYTFYYFFVSYLCSSCNSLGRTFCLLCFSPLNILLNQSITFTPKTKAIK